MDIKLNFLNLCEEQPTPTAMLFQPGAGGAATVAWKVIRNCASGWRHPFVFSGVPTIDLCDAFGNHLAPLVASNGSAFALTPLFCGRKLGALPGGAGGDHIIVRNNMPTGAYRANLYSAGALLASERLGPGMQAVFHFQPTLWIGVVPGASEGSVIDVAVACPAAVQFSLRGLASADLVMRDDDPPDGNPAYRFTLENVVRS